MIEIIKRKKKLLNKYFVLHSVRYNVRNKIIKIDLLAHDINKYNYFKMNYLFSVFFQKCFDSITPVTFLLTTPVRKGKTKIY